MALGGEGKHKESNMISETQRTENMGTLLVDGIYQY